MRITNELTLDVARSNSALCLLAKQGDSNSRYLDIKLTNEGHEINIPNGAGVILRATKADGTAAAVAGSVSGGKATVELDDYILDAAGPARASLEITADGEVLTTASFNLTVQKADGAGWVLVYVAASNLPAGNYYITLGSVSYSFTTTQTIPSGGRIYFSSNSATAQTRNGSGAVLDAALTLTVGTTGTALTSDLPTMSFLASLATTKADKDGVIAYADNLTPYDENSGAGQTQPFLAEGTGTGNGESTVDVGSFCQLKEKLGNTVCVNQLLDPAKVYTWTQSGLTISFDGTSKKFTLGGTAGATVDKSFFSTGATLTVKGHKYLFASDFSGGSGSLSSGYEIYAYGDDFGTCVGLNRIATSSNGGFFTLYLICQSGVAIPSQTFSINVIDLTLWFGSNDRIPSHLLDHPEDFGKYYGGSLDYNAGTLVNADGTTLKSIGRNCFDKSTYTDAHNYIDVSGLIINQTYHIMAENTTGLIQYKISTVYYGAAEWSSSAMSGDTFTVTKEIKDIGKLWIVNSSYEAATAAQIEAANVCISLYYSGESGYDQYYPYTVLAAVNTGSEVLRSARIVADEKAPDGTITRRVGTVDLGTLNWNYDSSNQNMSANMPSDAASTSEAYADIRCSRYATGDSGSIYYAAVNAEIGAFGPTLMVRDLAYNDAATFKTAMSGVMLHYKLAAPVTEQGTAFPENMPCDALGTLEWTETHGVPQGNLIFYPFDYKKALDDLLHLVNGDIGKIVTAAKVPDAPDADGTYVLKVTVSGGTPTYSWVAE